MNKEPVGLYIFRFFLAFGLFAFMWMLYWSSLLIEENMKLLRSDIGMIKNDLNSLRGETDKVRKDLIKTISKFQNVMGEPEQSSRTDLQKSRNSSIPQEKTESVITQESSVVTTTPNLLSADPFFEVTLPKLLGENFRPDGTLMGASIAKPDNLHPFNNYADVSGWIRYCVPSAATMKFGIYETQAPDLAIKMEERNREDNRGTEYWVHLRKDIYWEPLTPSMFNETVELAPHFLRRHRVTAHDFKFWYDAVMNPYNQERGALAIKPYFDDIEDFRVVDENTFVVRWKGDVIKDAEGKEIRRVKYAARQLTGGLTPLPSFVYQYFADGTKIVEDDSDPNTYRTNSVWANNFSQHWAKNIIISCGPWVFDKMTDRQIRFKRNQNYFSPLNALTQNIEINFKNTVEAVWQDFKSNKLDSYNIQPEQLIEFEQFLKTPTYQEQEAKGQKINRLDYIARSYFYIGWNQATPYFKNKKVRQAMTMAIDRERIIRQTLNGMGIPITGPFYVQSPSYNTSIAPWPYDPDRSKQLLFEEGWYDSDGDGIIDKEVQGKRIPFKFSLTYYVKNQIAKAICDYIATSFKEIGIECQLRGVDVADLSSTIEDKTFDALYMGWGLSTPPEDPKQLWHSSGARLKGSSNTIGFSNPEADEIIHLLQYESNLQKRIELYHRFHQIIHEEQPYTFIYTPKVAMLYRERLQNVFIPADRQDLIPGANVGEPDSSIYWLKETAIN